MENGILMKSKTCLENPSEAVEFYLLSQKFFKIVQDAHIVDYYAKKAKFDEAGRENTQGLVRKDLLLKQDEAIKIVCANDKSHTQNLTEGF